MPATTHFDFVYRATLHSDRWKSDIEKNANNKNYIKQIALHPQTDDDDDDKKNDAIFFCFTHRYR